LGRREGRPEAQAVLIEQDAHIRDAQERADSAAEIAGRLVGQLPADQALGLRLIALARAAAAVHMASIGTPDLRRSQAAALLREAGR